MNILFIHSTWYPTGGDWTYINEVKDLYEKNGHKVIPFSTKNTLNQESNFERYFIDDIDYKKINNKKSIINIFSAFLRTFYYPKALKNLKLLLEDTKIDIVQLHNIHNIFSLSIIFLLRKKKIPILWRVLDYKIICPNRTLLIDSTQTICTSCVKGSFINASIKKCKKGSFLASFLAMLEAYFAKFSKIYHSVDYFLLQNHFTKNLFINAGFDEDKLLVIKNPYKARPISERLGNDQYREFSYFGRLSSEKGLLNFLKMFNELNQQDLIFKIIGNGPQKEEISTFIKKNEITNVLLLGPVWGEELKKILSKSMFTVIPSIWHEPSPYAILQSYELGLPVLGSNLGGIPDIILNGKTGYLFDPADMNSFKYSFAEIVKNADSMKSNCTSYLKNHHSPDKYTKETIGLFERLL